MPLTTIEYGSLASSEVMNDNFGYLDNRITTLSNSLVSTSSTLSSNIAGVNSTLTQKNEELESDIEQLESDLEDLQSDFDNKDDAADYTSGISINEFPYTAPSDGYIDVALAALAGTTVLNVNGIKIAHAASLNHDYFSMLSGQYRVCEGDIISYTSAFSLAFQWAAFFPLKGGNDVLQN